MKTLGNIESANNNHGLKSSTLTSRIPYEAWLARGPPVFLYGGRTGLLRLRLGILWPDVLL